MLDMEESQPLRKPWQVKYEQICAEHNSKLEELAKPKQNIPEKSPSKEDTITNNPLISLLGHYSSDSESDEGDSPVEDIGTIIPSKEPKKELTEEVSIFLQEIQTIAPENTVIQTVSSATDNLSNCPTVNYDSEVQLPAADNPHYYEEQEHYMDIPVCAWQECYDDSSGCQYYWNMETNEVTWDMPPEYHAYLIQHQQWLEQTQAAMLYTEYVTTHMPNPAIIEAPAVITEPKIVAKKVSVMRRKRSSVKRTTKSKIEDSDEEEIELITSYGPASDEDSDESLHSKRRKVRPENIAVVSTTVSNLTEDSAPPQTSLKKTLASVKKLKKSGVSAKQHPQSIAACIASLQNENGMFGSSSLISSDFPYTGPPGEEGNNLSNTSEHTEADMIQSKHELQIMTEINEQELLIEATDEPSIGESSPLVIRTEESNEIDKDEMLILSQLCDRAKLLKDLGGDVPDEVCNLLYNEGFAKKQISDKREADCMEHDEEPKKEEDISPKFVEFPESDETNSFAVMSGCSGDSYEEEKKDISPKHKLTEKPTMLFPSMTTDLAVVKTNKTISTDTAAKSMTVSYSKSEQCPVSDCEISDSRHRIRRKKCIDIPLIKNGAEDSGTISHSVPSFTAQVSSPTEVVTCDRPDNPSKIVPYYKEHRGLGFQPTNEIDSKKLCFESLTQPATDISNNHGKMITFVKAETLNQSITIKDTENKDVPTEQILDEQVCQNLDNFTPQKSNDISERKSDDQVDQKLDDQHEKSCTRDVSKIIEIAEVIMEKVSLLADGKETISAVQTIGIQLETLATAWHLGSLCENYFSWWLSETLAELGRLEQEAAPAGWQCLWSGRWRRYYYYNNETGDVQWEYPTGDNVELLKEAAPVAKHAAEDCTEIHTLPGLSEYVSDNEEKYSEERKTKENFQEKIQLSSVNEKTEVSTNQELMCKLEELPPEAVLTSAEVPSTVNVAQQLPSESPPLTSLSPPLSPKLESPPQRQEIIAGMQPLPPGVDTPELPYIVARPTVLVTACPDLSDIDGVEMQNDSDLPTGITPFSLTEQYANSGVFMNPSVTSTEDHLLSTMEYEPAAYIEPAVTTDHVIVKPPAKASLHLELSSFYSDLASLEKEGAIPPADKETKDTNSKTEKEAIATSSHVDNIVVTENLADQKRSFSEQGCKHSETSAEVKKKKKTKLGPGLAMKKKGVSNLVAKWKRVQKEVRRDYKSSETNEHLIDK